MTKINKMVMHGFKSFAKQTELLFGDDFNCILGPNGSGKCVTGDTLIHLADGSLKPIKDIVDSKLKTARVKKIDDGFIAYDDDTDILSLDTETLKIRSRPIQAFVKRTSPKNLVKIQTRSGRKITATEYHPLFTLKDDKIQPIKAEHLKEGVRIAVPLHLKTRCETTFYELIDLITEEDEIYVPWVQKQVDILMSIKSASWSITADKIGIPKTAIKGLLDSQSINFAHLIKILRCANKTDKEIIDLIPQIKGKTSSKQYNMLWHNSEEFSRSLGYLLAEGRLVQSSNQIWFTNSCQELVKDYADNMAKVFGIKPSINEYKPACWDVLVYSSPLIKLLSKFGMSLQGTGKKTVSDLFLSHADDEHIANILNGLFCGGGHVAKSSIDIVTKSSDLAYAISTMLLRLGMTSHTKDIIKVATNSGFSGAYKLITIYGQDNFTIFNDTIKLVHPDKYSQVLALLGKKQNSNVDIIEANSLVKKAADDLGINIKRAKKLFPKIDAYSYDQCLPTRHGINELVDDLFIPSGGQSTESVQILQLLSSSDILWDEIVHIERIESKEKWVYDLCVEKDHNFIANNIVVHNSNILDALCFVLGKSSAKSMRAEKSANLIYNGGKTKKPAKQAEVSIYFDNSSGIFPTDEKEVKITRIVKATGQGVYKINDQTRTRAQILELLSLAKIDPDGYNIILQGDIIKIIDMTPVERRQIIEEVAGISVYEDKRQKALNEMDRVDGRLKEAEIILAERETYLKELKKDRDQAQKYKDLDGKITTNKATALYRQIQQKLAEKEELDERISKHKDALKKRGDETEKLRLEVKERKEKLSKINHDLEQRGEKDQITIHKDVEHLKVELATSKNRVETCKDEISKIKTRKDNLKESLKEVDHKFNEVEAQKKTMKETEIRLKKEQKEVHDRLKLFREKNKLDDVQGIEEDIDKLDKEAEDLQKSAQDIRQRQQDLFREKDRIEFQIQAVDEKITKVLEVEKENKDQIDLLKKQKEQFKRLTKELSQVQSQETNIAAELADHRQKALEATEELAKLRAKQSQILENAGANIAVRSILDNKKKFPGVHGTISELGEVSSKYSLALEVAAGQKIKSIVVETDKVGADCIAHLKKNKLGIATFIPMNKVRSRPPNPNADKIKNMAGVHGLAVDLITYDQKFDKVFKWVFESTVIVQDMNTARKIGVGQAKMVTLDGDIVELSGSMTGGFRQKRGGLGFSEKEVNNDIRHYEKIEAESGSRISKLQSFKQELEDKISNIREVKANLEGEIIKLEKSLHLDSEDIDINKKLKQELNQKLKDIDNEADKITMKVSENNKLLAQNKIKRQELREKINQLRSPTLLAELNAFEEKRRELTESLIKIESELKNLDIQAASMLAPEKENINKILKQHDKETDLFNEEIKQLQENIRIKQKELKDKESQEKKFYAQFKDLFAKKNKLDEEINKRDTKIVLLADEMRRAEHKINAIKIELAKILAQKAGLEKEFEQFEGVEIDHDKPDGQLTREINQFERMVENLGAVNLRALEVYGAAEKEYNDLLEKKAMLEKEKDDVQKMMDEIEAKKTVLFMKTFEVLQQQFQRIFATLLDKGEANLVLQDPESPFEAGLDIKVRLSGTKFLDIRSLSGGEKTMAALAFLFAVQEHEPASFYVLDEVDAALDKKNSEKLAYLIKSYCDKAQYILISHNDGVITEANTLYGISMDQHGVSDVLSLKI